MHEKDEDMLEVKEAESWSAQIEAPFIALMLVYGVGLSYCHIQASRAG